MMGWGSPYFPTVGPQFLSYQGVGSPSCGPKPMMMMGFDGFTRAPTRGWQRVGGGALFGGGALLGDGARTMGTRMSTGESSLARAGPKN